MIQTPIRYKVPQQQVTENRPVKHKNDFNANKNQVKVNVQILSKEKEKQATIPCPLDAAVQKDSAVASGSKVLNGGELLGRYIFLVDEKNERNSVEKIQQKESKKSRHVDGTMFQTKCDNEEGSSDEESESSIDVVEGHEVVLKTSSEKTTSDDPDYLQLLEAHQQRLEDAASGFANSDVHFVEGDQATMYGNAPGSFSYGESAMFGQQGTPTSYLEQHQAAYSTPATNSPTMVPGTQGQVITYQHATGLAGQINPRPPITHTTRASPATVAWLLENYETSEGVSLPRSTLYNHYLQHCQANKLDAVNAASFGKLIRSVFVGLKTRRLGTRGNSKYHYYGIRIQPNSPLNALVDHEIQGAMRQSPSAHKSRLKLATKVENEPYGDEQSGVGEDSQQTKNQQEQHQQYLGDISQGLPEFKPVQTITEPLPDGINNQDIMVFSQLYREHCQAILEVVVNLQFVLVETLWHTFWRAPVSEDENKQESQSTSKDLEERLPKTKLTLLCNYQPILDYVKDADHVLYQTLVETLIPEVLRPIPGSLTSAIRNYAKCLENWLLGSLVDIPQKMVDLKTSTCSAFSQTLRRYTSLNHLAQAARAVLQNPQQINQMLTDLNRVDFANVQEQASWVCQCDDEVVNQLEADFKATLSQQNSLEKWAEWLEGVVNKVLSSTEGTPAYPKAARQFLLKWSFYSSMVIRDLTLRSAASFGSFHLIRLLYDEYMFYLIEHKVAAATEKSPIAVMGEFVGLGANLAAALAPLDAFKQNGLGDSGSEVASEDDFGDSKDVKPPSTDIPTSDEPDVKKQRTN